MLRLILHFTLLLGVSNFSLRAQAPTLYVLGTVQDAGAPQLGCNKSCCNDLTESEKAQRSVSSLGLCLANSDRAYLFDASPDLPRQWHLLQQKGVNKLAGVFLTHAHMGHYAGLLHLGREAWNTNNIPVYAMPRMQQFIRSNAPWEQLISLKNIQIQPLTEQNEVVLPQGIRVTPILVPHRDEYSETIAYWIQGPNKSALYLPDIDKWDRWDVPIENWIKKVDYAFLDATFFDGNELPNRVMSEIPHPFVVESMSRFKKLSKSAKEKIYFIHLNHTNPLLKQNSPAYQNVLKAGFSVAQKGQEFDL
ncbi:MAG: MBL fold metallo-hydrolase [Flavobacteriaceae bacterium]